MNIDLINSLDRATAKEAFYKCCSCKRFVEELIELAPFKDKEDLFSKAGLVWAKADEQDKLEAFKGHPKIGDMDSLRAKYSNTKNWSSTEQSGAMHADESVLLELQNWNLKYEEKFGFIFIVCATGKSALEMLEILKSRFPNTRDQEIEIAAEEQLKITKIRLEKIQ